MQYVTTEVDQTTSIIDPKALKIVDTIPTGQPESHMLAMVAHPIDAPAASQKVLIRPDNQLAYVSCGVSGKVAAISTSDWKISKLIEAGKTVDGLASAAAR